MGGKLRQHGNRRNVLGYYNVLTRGFGGNVNLRSTFRELLECIGFCVCYNIYKAEEVEWSQICPVTKYPTYLHF